MIDLTKGKMKCLGRVPARALLAICWEIMVKQSHTGTRLGLAKEVNEIVLLLHLPLRPSDPPLLCLSSHYK